MALLAGIITVQGYDSFRRLIEHRLLDIPLPPTHLLERYATRITANLDRKSLVQLLTVELLPSLLVHQSALLYLNGSAAAGRSIDTLYRDSVDSDGLPEVDALETLISQSEKYRPYLPTDGRPQPCTWAYLILPLYTGGSVFGLWLLGHRDPDDLYSQRDIATLRTLADQTAVALANVLQAENLQTLYQANIERHEAERARLAWELHDEVLHQIGILNMNVAEQAATSQFQRTYQRLKSSLRLMITGLRPAMLMYGLSYGLEELVDTLNERAAEGPVCRLHLPTSDVRYPAQVEQHLFRIVQQAAENALRHAQAKTIEISGTLLPEAAELVVSDDGQGFHSEGSLNLPDLLARKHYGLVNMHERARLIDARLTIDAAPGQGVRVAVSWMG
jgi:signal transduction histidine kinase